MAADDCSCVESRRRDRCMSVLEVFVDNLFVYTSTAAHSSVLKEDLINETHISSNLCLILQFYVSMVTRSFVSSSESPSCKHHFFSLSSYVLSSFLTPRLCFALSFSVLLPSMFVCFFRTSRDNSTRQ